jgi:hypothetical protein
MAAPMCWSWVITTMVVPASCSSRRSWPTPKPRSAVLYAFDTGHAANTGYIFGEPGPAALVTADVIAPLGSWSPKG